MSRLGKTSNRQTFKPVGRGASPTLNSVNFEDVDLGLNHSYRQNATQAPTGANLTDERTRSSGMLDAAPRNVDYASDPVKGHLGLVDRAAQNYTLYTEPLINKQIDAMNNRQSLYDDTKGVLATLPAQMTGMDQRNLARTGVNLTPAQRLAMQRGNNSAMGRVASATLNNSRLADVENTRGFNTAMFDAYAAQEQSGTNLVGNVAGSFASEKNAQEAKVNRRTTGTLSTAMMLGGLALGL